MFIDASNEFIRSDTKNKLTDINIQNIIDLLRNRENVEYKSILISNDKILKNDSSLSVNTYLKQESMEEKIDIKKLNLNIKGIVKKEQELRESLDEIIQELEVMYSE